MKQLRVVAVSIALTLVVGSAFAADFPIGSYSAHQNLTIVFDKQGTFHVTQDGKSVVIGNYRIKGDQLELTDRDGPWACTKAGQQSGTYQWKYGDAGLTLTKVTDACEERGATLATSSWKPKT